MIAFFKAHPALPVLMILVSIVFGSWHIFNIHFLANSRYYPITGEGDEMYYGQRARAVFTGNFIAGDIALWENQKSPAFLPILNPMIMGALGKLTGSLEKGIIASDFILPPLIFAALYFLAYELTQSEIGAILFASIFIFTPQIVTFPSVSSLEFFTKGKTLYFSRFEYPKLTFIFYALAFYFILRALKHKKQRDVWLGGLMLGLTFYTYFHDCASIFAALALMAVMFLLQKDYERVKIIFFLIIVSIAVSGLYWLNFWHLHNLPSFKDIVMRVGGMEISRKPYLLWNTYLRIIVLLAAVTAVYFKRNKLIFTYLAANLLAYFIVANAQVIIGFNLHPDHWYRTAFLPWGLTFFALGVWFYNKLPPLNAKLLAISAYFLIAVLGLWGLISNYRLAEAIYDRYRLPAWASESYDWLNKNTPPRSTVGSISPDTEDEIQLHAHNTVFVPNGANTIAPEEEIWERTAWAAKIYGMNVAKFKNLLENSSMYLFHMRYRDYSYGSTFVHEYYLDPVKYEKEYKGKIEKYIDAEKKFDPKSPSFHLDYLYFGPREKALGLDPQITNPNIKKVYDNDQATIYKILNP